MILFIFSSTQFTFAQTAAEPSDYSNPGEAPIRPKGTKKHPLHKDLETELEIYPFNIVVPDDPVIKNEAMFDYHMYSDNEKFLGGVRFFADANTHYKDGRNMQDLLMYTEAYYGFRNFQLGAEIGSVTGEEYMSVGPQFAIYDNHIFKRVAIISRVVPDFVLGYEFTTQELKVTENIKLSATGMGRIIFPSDQRVFQASAWVSFEKVKYLYIGVEYEYNNAAYYNTYAFERNQELFLGVKFELK